ncbi:MAG: Rieske 2Fe-2S domain-containing protein [Sphingomonas sp.]
MRADENDLLCRTGPDAPMGKLMREYWIPALMSSELQPGGEPVRLRLLGENFLAFRSPDGKVGIVDHQCAHRCASLFYGRNEEGGIRCVYHGWKFDHQGQCIEMPSEPPETDYKDRVKIDHCAVIEKYNIVWAYFGKGTPPALPQFDMEEIAEEDIESNMLFRECNYLQALEGDIDTCHVGFLHLGGMGPDRFEPGSLNYYRQLPENLAPKYEAMETEYGSMYSAYRPAGDETYHRIGQFAMPFWTAAPSAKLDTIRWRAWVPVDDDHSMLVVIGGRREPPLTIDKHGKPLPGAIVELKRMPNTTDWLGRWRIENNPRNDHLIDRAMQRDQNYTGISGIPVQDQATTESMGPIVDRTKEHLGTSDRMIMMTRRLMMRQARALVEEGTVPVTATNPELFRYARAGFVLLPEERDWLDAYNEYRAKWSNGAAVPIERVAGRRTPGQALERA